MLSLILLIGFIKISIHYNNPLVLAGGYTLLTTLIAAAFANDLMTVLVSAILTLSLTWLFFWLLDRFEESGVWWILVLIFPVLMFMLSRVAG